MKKWTCVWVIVGLLVMGVVSISSAGVGGTYQWHSRNTTTTAPGIPAEKCEFYQWRRPSCTPEVAPTPAPRPERIVLEGIYFDTGSSTIKRESYPVLDRNVQVLNSRTNKSIVVVGHTDDRGSDRYNQRLSEARARSVMNYFTSRGIDSNRIRAAGRGETQPRATNTTENGRAQNRRIEIEFAK